MIMKKSYLIVAVLILLITVTAGCDVAKERVVLEGSGNNETITEDFIGFNRLEVSHVFDVDITQGEEYSIVLRVDEEFLDYIDVSKRGNTLDIDLDDKYNYNFKEGLLEASITMPELLHIRQSGASKVTIDGFDSSNRFEADLSGASTLTGVLGAGDVKLGLSGASKLSGEYHVKHVDLDASGASKVTLSGSGNELELIASGSSIIDLSDFMVEDAVITVSGSSEAVVNANGLIDADASGASRVYYLGDGEMGDVSSSGASTIQRGE
jgi:hypothetical protein